MKLLQLIPLILVVGFFLIPQNVDGSVITQTMEGSMDVEITYPESTIVGEEFPVSIFVKNNGWENKQDIIFLITIPDESIVALDALKVNIEKLSVGGSYGTTLNFKSINAIEGTHYINLLYSQVLMKDNIEPLESTESNIAIPIIIKKTPAVIIHTETPESIFPNAEFPVQVEVISHDIDLDDVKIQVVAPQDIEFRGQSTHTFSSIQQNVPITVISTIITPQEDLTNEKKIPFEVIVSYVDNDGLEKKDSKTIPLLLRPRTFMELTTDGGIWIGSFFLAPYVSLGTIIGIPAGTIISLAIRRSQTKKKRKRKK